MEVYQQCILLDEDTDAAASVWEAKSLEVSADVDVMRGKVQTAFAAMDRALKAQAVRPPPPVPTSVQRIRVVDTLKPFLLKLEHNPVEFRNWKRKLDAFFSASHLSQATTVDQQAYVRQFLDADLDSRIAPLILDLSLIHI